MLDQITPLILTYNEIANIERSIKALSWAKKILVVDSFSDDGTVEYCQAIPNVELKQREFDNFANQCNHALVNWVDSPWVLSLDADYIVTPELVDEFRVLNSESTTDDCFGYSVGFLYAMQGRVLRGSLYPPRTVLYRGNSARYVQDGHAHRIKVDGLVGGLNEKIIHDDRKSHARWFDSQVKYAKQEKQKLKAANFGELSLADKLRCIPLLSLLLMVPYLLVYKGLAFSGVAGVAYLKERLIAEWLLQKELFFR